MIKNSTRLILFNRQLWTPANISGGLALWLDAADFSTIVLNGSTVSEWRDKSGNGRHASMATAANQPTYILSGLNNNPGLSWDGINDSMIISGGNVKLHSALSNSDNHSVSMLVQPNKISNQPVFLYVPITVNEYRFLFESTNNGGLYWASSQVTQRIYSSDFFVVNRASFFIANKINSTSGDAYVNGNLRTNFSSNFNQTGILSNEFWLGSSPVTALNYNGIFCEIVITNFALSTADRERLEGYFAHKWGLTANLPDNHPFKFTAPKT